MYYVDGDRIMKENYCFSAGPPQWNWNMFNGLDMDKIPFNASMVPGMYESISLQHNSD